MLTQYKVDIWLFMNFKQKQNFFVIILGIPVVFVWSRTGIMDWMLGFKGLLNLLTPVELGSWIESSDLAIVEAFASSLTEIMDWKLGLRDSPGSCNKSERDHGLKARI